VNPATNAAVERVTVRVEADAGDEREVPGDERQHAGRRERHDAGGEGDDESCRSELDHLPLSG
jgi:hypothetical protein